RARGGRGRREAAAAGQEAPPAPAEAHGRRAAFGARARRRVTQRQAHWSIAAVFLLIVIGLLAGIVTAISPCVLPVLPILLAGGASGRKPFRVITGLIASFVVFTLFASWLLDKLGLPQDLLRNIAIALLFLVAATLLVPA